MKTKQEIESGNFEVRHENAGTSRHNAAAADAVANAVRPEDVRWQNDGDEDGGFWGVVISDRLLNDAAERLGDDWDADSVRACIATAAFIVF